MLDWTFLVVALALAGYAQYQLMHDERTKGVLAFAGAMVAFAWAVRRERSGEPGTAAIPAPPLRGWPRLLGAGLLVAALGCVAATLILFRGSNPMAAGWPPYLASMFLLTVGFMAMEWGPDREWWLRAVAWLRRQRWDLFFLFVFVAVGGLLRFAGLDVLPYGVWYDESVNAEWAQRILVDSDFRPLYVAPTTMPSHFLYLIATSFRIFGVGILALRFVTAAFGTATIIVMWLLGRELGGRWVGLLAAGLMAASHWAINFSRIGMHGITTPFFAVLTTYLALRGLRSGGYAVSALGGLILGLGLWYYAPFRLFPFVIALFLLGKLLRDRGFLRRRWMHVTIYIVASLIAFAPIGQYALQNREEFFARTKQASVFTGKTREDGILALKENIRRHILMFNYQGDRNGRHNLPGEPMVDPVSGALLPLGLAYALARLHRPRQLLLVGWLVIMLIPAIFSLDFEAPQSLRAIGTLPVVLLMIAQVVPAIGKGLLAPLRTLQPAWPRMVATGTLAAVVTLGFGYSGFLNYQVYFEEQARSPEVFHAHNARETAATRMMVERGEQYRFYTLYHGHPTVRYLAPNVPDHRPFDVTNDLPVRGLVDRDVMYVMEPEFAPPPALFRAWYPGGELKTIPDIAGEPMLFTYQVSQEEVNALQGVNLELYSRGQGAEAALPLAVGRQDELGGAWDTIRGDDDVRGEWIGQVFVPLSGSHTLHLHSAGAASLSIDRHVIELTNGGDADEPLMLIGGWHPVRLVADSVPGGEVSVEWTLPDGRREPIPREALHVGTGLEQGLYGLYYSGLDWAGLPVFGRIDWQVDFRWHIQPLDVPYSVEWHGGLKVDEPGSYVLALQSNSGASLEVNGEMVIDAMQPPHGRRQAVISLDAGVHTVRVRYHEPGGYSEMRLWWQPPGGPLGAIPAKNLTPSVPETSAQKRPTVATPPAQTDGVTVGPLGQVEPLTAWGGEGSGEGQLRLPRGVAIGPQGQVYVADTGNGRVQCFQSDGTFVRAWSRAAKPLQEPFDIAVDGSGHVYVLDSGRQIVARYSPDGEFEAEIGGDLTLSSPRGLGLDRQGNIYVADTGTTRVVKISAEGELLAVLATGGSGPGQVNQPTDVAVDADGRIYIADTMNRRLEVLDANGRYLGEWALAPANTTDGPHLDITAGGHVLVTDPEAHKVLAFDPQGASLGSWGSKGDGLGQFHKTLGVAAGPDGLVAVTDCYNHRVQVFSLDGE